jgi:hypothetical protein
MKYSGKKRIADRIVTQILLAASLWLWLASLFLGVDQATDPGYIPSLSQIPLKVGGS